MSTSLEDDVDYELPAWSRTCADWRSRFVLPFTLDLRGTSLNLEQAPCVSSEHAAEASASADGLCTAGTVWDAGVVLAAYTHAQYADADATATAERRCLDLGSGTGIVGLAAAVSGAFGRVVLTDLPSVVPLLERNVLSNRDSTSGCAEVEVRPLAWDDAAALRSAAARGPFDLIVGGDLLYRPQVVEPLLAALDALATRGRTLVLLAASMQHSPETLRAFVKRARSRDFGFDVELLGSDAQAEGYASEEVRLFRLTRAVREPRGAKRRKVEAAAPAMAAVAPAMAAVAVAVAAAEAAGSSSERPAPVAAPSIYKGLTCAACGLHRDVVEFSAAQIKKNSRRRCKACVTAPAAARTHEELAKGSGHSDAPLSGATSEPHRTHRCVVCGLAGEFSAAQIGKKDRRRCKACLGKYTCAVCGLDRHVDQFSATQIRKKDEHMHPRCKACVAAAVIKDHKEAAERKAAIKKAPKKEAKDYGPEAALDADSDSGGDECIKCGFRSYKEWCPECGRPMDPGMWTIHGKRGLLDAPWMK